MKWISLLLLTMSTQSYADSLDMNQLKQSIREAFAPLIGLKRGQSPKGFQVNKCPEFKPDWGKVITMRERPTYEAKFATGCDIEGKATPTPIGTFPVDFKFRNLKGLEKVFFQAQLKPIFESPARLRLEGQEGVFTSDKGPIKFQIWYEVEIDPMGDKFVKRHVGGELTVTEYQGKAVELKEKLKWD